MLKRLLTVTVMAISVWFCGPVFAADEDLTATPHYHNTMTLADMGLTQGIVFRGGQMDAGVGFSLPIDQLVTQAQMTLDLRASDSLLGSDMALRIRVNGQVIGAIPLSSVNEQKTSYQLNVPALLVSSRNTVSFSLASDDQSLCYQDEGSQSQQIEILSSSKLQLNAQQLDIAADLHYFPKPFWDVQDMLDTPIRFVFADKVTPSQVSAAAALSSWFGVQASYRGVSFDVSKGQLPMSNAIVFGMPGEKIGRLTLPQTDKPLLQVVPNPMDPLYKLLLVVADDDVGIRSAVHRLTRQNFAMQTVQYTVEHQTIAQSAPYDAPRWISTSAPVPLSELSSQGENMVAKGIWHNSLDFSFRAAPDLFLWDGETIPLNIDYRFPADSWIDPEQSFLNVVFNGQFLDDLPVNKRGVLEQLWRRLGGDARQETAQLPIQPYMIYGDNQLSLYFNVKPQADAPCGTALDSNIRSRIQNSSTIDLSETQHFSLLPNLSFFVGASFPFSRLADYSQTLLWLPSEPTAAQLQTLFSLNARSGAATGTAIFRNQVLLGAPTNNSVLEGKDILAVSSMAETRFNRLLMTNTPFHERDNTLHVHPQSWSAKLLTWLQGHWGLTALEAERYFSSNEVWRGFISFESPWSEKRTVIVATATSDEQLMKIEHDLKVPSINAAIRGDATVITDENGATSFNVAPQFPSGQLPWYKMAIWYANQHSAVFALLTLFISLILGLAVYRRLERKAEQRLNEA
ncbi:cellulose biosynthesis cyclic di-GMP-binding regulatory protein BcsB [Vibrio sp. AK197]